MADYLIQHQLEWTASLIPETTAVVDGDTSITYGELNSISNQVANQLINSGCIPGTTIAVYLPKSLEAIIVFYGVLKAGGAYVPLDAHYSPPKRIITILELNNPNILVTNTKCFDNLLFSKNRFDIDIIFADTLLKHENISTRENSFGDTGNTSYLHRNISDTTPDMSSVHENCLAYVLYTSGSTGVPKGVMISHRNALTFINWALDVFKPAPETIFANHAPFHFDLSVFDLFAAFAAGGTVHLVPANVMNSPRALVDWIERSKIEIWYSVPSIWTTMLNYAAIDPDSFSRLKMILFAGEVFPSKDLKKLMRLFPEKLFFNLYGPTETNVCTYHEIRSVNEIDNDFIPIGKACENTVVRAFDEEMREVQVGETGELYVVGPGVFIGYYGEKERTKKVFKNVFSTYAEQAWYATGDLVRRLDQENYRYVGRKDLMVKCSGFRIELPEIEHVLLQHYGIRDAVVIPVYREQRSTYMLKAFISLRPSTELSVLSIKQWCGDLLPQYMIPEVVTILNNLPKNSNGKTDRQKLAELSMVSLNA